MVDPATATGLVLGVVPLIISALENYESIIQPVKIFTSTYRDEVERFRNQLKIEQSRFREECKWLLKTVLASDQPQIMIKNTQHFLWQDQQNLEAELRVRLNENYEACEAALHSIIDVQARILKDTKDIDILMKEVCSLPLASHHKPEKMLDIVGIRSIEHDQGDNVGVFILLFEGK